jgi:hypothetical protein
MGPPSLYRFMIPKLNSGYEVFGGNVDIKRLTPFLR